LSNNILVTYASRAGSTAAIAQAIAQAQSASVVVYAIGLGRDADQNVLQRIATETVGTDEEWSVPHVGTQGELGPAWR
jgi:flavodoxin